MKCIFVVVFKAYLCLDSVYVSCDGELLFLMPKNTGTAVHNTVMNTKYANTIRIRIKFIMAKDVCTYKEFGDQCVDRKVSSTYTWD